MNYYEHHIGDYAEATAHLTFIEDAAYSRMIRKYYAQEKPLPADLKAVQRLIGARTKEEREAVETVLSEFFKLEDDGWHNGRCDVEVGRYLDKSEGKDSKRENERERQRRHRQRRKELFQALREHGEVPPFATSNEDLVELLERVTQQPVTRDNDAAAGAGEDKKVIHSGGVDNFISESRKTGSGSDSEIILCKTTTYEIGHANVTQPVTRDITANQSPVTSHQSPDLKEEASPQASSSVGDDLPKVVPSPTAPPQAIGRNVAISILLRGYGIDATAGNPLVCLDWAENPKVTDELLTLAAVKAKSAKPDQRISVNYLKPIVAELLAAPESKAKPKTDDWEWKRSDGGIERKGREMGMFARGGESYRDFAGRIDDEIRKRKGPKP